MQCIKVNIIATQEAIEMNLKKLLKEFKNKKYGNNSNKRKDRVNLIPEGHKKLLMNKKMDLWRYKQLNC